MSKLSLVVVAIAALGCGNKKQDKPAEQKPVEPIACPAGQVSQDGACVVVVTPEKVEAVVQQQSRIDELEQLLEQADSLSAPIELLNGLRALDAWKALAATNDQAKLADEIVAQLDNAVKTMRTFKASLGEVETRLGDLKGELDKLMADTGTRQQLAEVQAQISAKVKATVEPFAVQVQETIQNAIVPLTEKLDEVSAIVDIACGTVKLKGGAQAKALCKDAKDIFGKAETFLADVKDRPAKLYDELATTLVAQLDLLVDAQTKSAIAAAQTKVNEALKLPGAPAPAGSVAAPVAPATK